jgi:hypothetical protein
VAPRPAQLGWPRWTSLALLDLDDLVDQVGRTKKELELQHLVTKLDTHQIDLYDLGQNNSTVWHHNFNFLVARL